MAWTFSNAALFTDVPIYPMIYLMKVYIFFSLGLIASYFLSCDFLVLNRWSFIFHLYEYLIIIYENCVNWQVM